MKKIQQTLNLLKKILKDENCKRMSKSIITGFYGELIVKEKLRAEGKEVIHVGKQASYDLEYDEIKIEVKSSLLKNESNMNSKYWGWPLKRKDKDEEKMKCTHFVCVAMNEEYHPVNFYVIKKKHIKKFPGGINHYNKVEHCFLISNSEIKSNNKEIKKVLSKSSKLITKGCVKKIGINESISRSLEND